MKSSLSRNHSAALVRIKWVTRALIVVVLAGCYPPSLDVPGTHVDLDCLDVAVATRYELQLSGPVIVYSLANQCRRRVMVDLASVRVVVRDSGGHERELHAHDPRHEIAALPLPALVSGREEIEYADPAGGL